MTVQADLEQLAGWEGAVGVHRYLAQVICDGERAISVVRLRP